MASPYRSILVPVDFSPACSSALEGALSWARRFDAKLEVLHVWSAPAYVSPELQVELGAGQGKKRLVDVMHQVGEQQMQQLLTRVPPEDLPRIRAVVRAGEPYSAILEHAAQHDLMIMGTQGRRGLEALVLGSTAERIVRNSTRPVLVVKAGQSIEAPKRILVPIDFSNHARLALTQAAALAQAFGAEVLALHVIKKMPAIDGLEGLALSYGGDSVRSYEHFALAHAQKELELFLSQTPGHEAKKKVVHGDSVKEILETISAGGADLVVIGRRGRTLLGIDLGSTALKVLRAAPVPVLAVHDPTPIEPLEGDV
jgi:nucleotide-binding universal stress UspA family protein